MSCGCNSNYLNTCTCGCAPTNCSSVCGALTVSNSWNIPACGANATLTVKKLKNLQLNSFLWNPSYGYFKITSFNAVTGEVVIENTCVEGNSSPGTIVPACTNFIVTDTPFAAQLTFGNSVAFIMPACGDTVVVETNGVPNVVIGSYVWNPTAGFLEVTAYNSSTFDLTLQNNCNAGNVAPGATVVAESSFFLTPPPAAGEDTTWTPGVTGSGAMTISALVINQATYWEVGNLVFFILGLSFTVGGVVSTSFNITLGTEAITFGSGVAVPCDLYDAGTFSDLGRWTVTTGNPGTIIVAKGTAANFTLGACTIYIQGFYQKV